MFQHRMTIVTFLITGIIACGCRSNTPPERGDKVVEFRPEWKPVEKQAPASTVYVLWGWKPIRRFAAATTGPALGPTTGAATTGATTGPANNSAATRARPPVKPLPLLPGEAWERATEIRQVYARRGAPIGFRKVRGQLIAVAGPTTMPLAMGHYGWHELPGNPSDEETAALRRRDAIVRGVLTVGAIILLVGIVFVALRYDHEDGCGCDN